MGVRAAPFRERLIGRIILLLGGVVAVAMPIIHLNGRFPPHFSASDSAFRFVWTSYALGTLGLLTVILALRERLARSSAIIQVRHAAPQLTTVTCLPRLIECDRSRRAVSGPTPRLP